MSSPTIKEVAARSGVGIGTVSRVLNNSPQISEETRQKVLKAIKELNYVPNVAGKRLSQKRSYVLAVIVPIINHPFFSKLIADLELAADEKGYSLLVVSSQHRIEKEHEILKRLTQNEADGALFVTHFQHDEKEFQNLAIVTIDRHLGNNVPIVTSNNYEATKEGVEYLINQGCHKIAFLGSKPEQLSEVSLREQGYRAAIKEHHLEPLVINESIEHGGEETLVDEFLDKHQGFDGIFVSGCVLADILVKKMKERGLNIPKDVQVVSYDGEFFRYKPPRVTSLEQPIDLMAKRCVELLIKLIDKKDDFERINKFDCRFVKGDTTK